MDREPRGAPSLAGRAALAIGLTVAFYAVAVTLALGMLYLAWAMLDDGKHISGHLLVFLLVGGFGILWGVLPRWERFEAPGPLLTPEEQPRLFTELRRIAKATGQEMPGDVYLVGDLNAGVLQRGGAMGFGGRRVMILGLPLMAVFTQDEFRAVLAHEFGHFSGGETSIGNRIYRTQSALFRTIRVLAEAGSLMRFPFIWYAKSFLRITNSISRRQELAADRLAAELGGAAALGDGLRKLAAMGHAYPAFFQVELVPVFASGFRPPVVAGFQRFVSSPDAQETTRITIEATLEHEKEDPFDSHPPLRVRLENLGSPAPRRRDGAPLAVDLLDDLPALEERLLKGQFPTLADSRPLEWKDVGREVFLPQWRDVIAKERRVLGETTADGLAEVLRPVSKDSRWAARSPAGDDGAGKTPRVAQLAGLAMMVALVDRGWSLVCLPGEEVTVFDGPRVFAAFQEIENMRKGETSPAAWAERCRELGLAGFRLADSGSR